MRLSTRIPIASLLLLAVFCWLAVFSVGQAQAQAQMKVTTVAGGAVWDGGPATSAAFNLPRFGTFDKAGNMYITDGFAHRIRKVNKEGAINTVVGNGIAGFSGDGGPAKSAGVSYPLGIVFDAAGNMLFSDQGNNRIRKVDTHGIITTIAGNGDYAFVGDGGPATAASLAGPFGLALDKAGNLYICDQGNQRVRKIDTHGIITTVAGNGDAGYSGDGGPAIAASLNFPYAVILDGKGNLYIGDYNNMVVRKVDAKGTITTFAGNNTNGCDGDGGLATAASTGGVGGFALGPGVLLMSTNGCSRVREVDLRTNIITTVVGLGNGYDGDGNPPLSTRFRGERGLFFDSAGNLFIVDRGNQRVRKLDTHTQIVSTVAGGYLGDGWLATGASLDLPNSIYYDGHSSLYIADTNHNRVRKLSSNGVITTSAGTGITGYSGDGGPATQATLNTPQAVATDPAGNVFIADGNGLFLRKVDTAGTITTFANFDYLFALATDAAGNIYGAGLYSCLVWKITPDGTPSIIAGVDGNCGYNADGIPGDQAWLNSPNGIAVDAKGNVLIADTWNCLVRKLDAITGLISTVAGNLTCGYSGDGGPATSAALYNPMGIALDNRGNLYIADLYNVRVRSVDPSGTIQTLAGTGVQGYNGNGLPALLTNIDAPTGLTVDRTGAVYISDTSQDRVRRIK